MVSWPSRSGKAAVAPDFHLFLMRHGAAVKPYHSGQGTEQPSKRYPHLLLSAERQAVAVALRLGESIVDLIPGDDLLHNTRIWTSGVEEARETARALATTLERQFSGTQHEATECSMLTPRRVGRPDAGQEDTVRLLSQSLDDLLTKAAQPGTSGGDQQMRALIIVGHEPQLGLVAARLAGHPIPIDRGELVYLAGQGRPAQKTRRRWVLRWTIHPDDGAAVADIQAKIKSKMDTAKVFGAFVTGLVTFVLAQMRQLGSNIDPRTWLLWAASVVLLLTGAVLFFAALFFYDSLLMPVRFWPSQSQSRRAWASTVSRPPSSSAWVLYQNMTRIWNRTFTVGILIVSSAVIVLGAAILPPSHPALISTLIFLAFSALVVVLAGWSIWSSRPNLGTSD